LGVVCIKVMVDGKAGDENAEDNYFSCYFRRTLTYLIRDSGLTNLTDRQDYYDSTTA